MKATIINVREGAHKTAERHTIVVSFSEKRENVTGIASVMMSGIIAGGINTYDATFDLIRIFNALSPQVQEQTKTNGIYDPAKGFNIAISTLFKVGTEIDHELFNLFVIPILEVSNGKCASVNVQVGSETRTMSAYRKAGFFDRETCLSICKAAYAANVKNGIFTENLPTETATPQTAQTAQQTPQISLADLLGGANAPE